MFQHSIEMMSSSILHIWCQKWNTFDVIMFRHSIEMMSSSILHIWCQKLDTFDVIIIYVSA